MRENARNFKKKRKNLHLHCTCVDLLSAKMTYDLLCAKMTYIHSHFYERVGK